METMDDSPEHGERRVGCGEHRRGTWLTGCGLLLAVLGWVVPAVASNGLNLIGFGAESVGMGGADLAVARDTTAMNTNPAGLTQIRGHRVDLYGAATYALDVRHRDAFGNDRAVATNTISPPGSATA